MDMSMALADLLLRSEATILKGWVDLILQTYPADDATLMGKEKNRFTNPVGSTISREIEILFKNLCQGSPLEKCDASLDSILKIRSVQDFSPSEAVGFVFLLKRAIEETLKNEISKGSIMDEWLKFEAKIDKLALRAFDIYMGCREKVCEIRINQARAEKEMAFKAMERMAYKKEK